VIFRAFFLVLLALSLPAQAQQYRWVDKDGRLRFSDTPPPPGAKDVRKTDSPAAGPAPAPAPLPFALVELQQNFPVTLFTSPNCKEFCVQARAALNKRGVPFSEVQVWNEETLEQLKKASGSDSVPVLVVGRSKESGFDQGRFDALLDSAGYPPAGVFPARAQAAPPVPEGYEPPQAAEPVTPPEAAQKPGPYDASGLQGPPPKPGIYDPSGLQGPPPKPGPYITPAESK
jgi:glutaredoxin